MGWDWLERAACRRDSERRELFMRTFDAQEQSQCVKDAKQVCLSECPVAEQCLWANLHERVGVFGGLTGRERRRYLRRRANARTVKAESEDPTHAEAV